MDFHDQAVQLVIDVANRGVQPCRNRCRRRAVAIEPQSQRAQRAQQQPDLKRAGNRADVLALRQQLLRESMVRDTQIK